MALIVSHFFSIRTNELLKNLKTRDQHTSQSKKIPNLSNDHKQNHIHSIKLDEP